ncbi:hypothetical protein [Bartonella sp. MR100HLJHH]|uniref:hypothetical protein n=1 Tax=Bartonella sp. MR100HLJHH TaxID=3243554 RepID=UPI0035D0463F
MSNDLFFLLLLVFSYLFIVVVIGTYKVSKRFDIPWWRAAFYCICGISLFLKEVLFYCILGVVFFLALLGDGEYGYTVGTPVLDRDRVCCSVGVVLDFAYEGAARWGADALFVAIEGAGVLRRCWSDLFLFAFGSREYGVGLALVLEGLGVFYHLWIYPSCCFCGSKACACEGGGVFKESGVYGALQITSRE